MKRFDLRYLKNDFYDKMLELMDKQISSEETAIIMFEIGDFSNIQKSADVIYEAGYTLMNSIKFKRRLISSTDFKGKISLLLNSLPPIGVEVLSIISRSDLP